MRLDPVRRHTERPLETSTCRRRPKVALAQRHDRWHQPFGRQPLQPLTRRHEVASVERQGSAVLLPHAVAVAEAHERAVMPVVDDARPGVAERLTVDRGQRAVDRVGPAPIGRLSVVAQILGREALDVFLAALVRLMRSRERTNDGAAGSRNVAQRRQALQHVEPNHRPQPREVVQVGVALAAAPERVDEQRMFEPDDMRLLHSRRRRPQNCGHTIVDGEAHPSVERRNIDGLQHDEIGRGWKSFTVPIGGECQRDRLARARSSSRRGDLCIELSGFGRTHPPQFLCAEVRLNPLVRLISCGGVREHIRRTNRLIEPKRNDDPPIVTAAGTVPLCPQQTRGRRDEAECVGPLEAVAADGHPR